jgi:hypothetical protein
MWFRFFEVVDNLKALAPWAKVDCDPVEGIATFAAAGIPVQIVIWIEGSSVEWTTNSHYFARLIKAC